MNSLSIANVQEGRALFAAHKQQLAARGIVLPSSVNMYLPTAWKHDIGMAMDAQPTLSTDPSSAIPSLLTTAIDPEVLRAIFSPLQFAKFLDERKVGDWTEDTRMFPIVEETGEVSSYGDFNNNGRAGINMNWPQFQSYLFQIFEIYGEREIDRMGLAKINYVSELQISSADLLNRFQNLTYAFGVATLQNYGMLNNPFLSANLTPALKAWGGVGWFNGNVPAASANEVYADIQTMVTKLIAQTGGAVELDSPMTLAMSPNSQVAMTFANAFGVYVKNLLKEGFPNIKIVTAPQYGTQSTTNPQGFSAAGNLLQLWADKVQGQKMGYAAFNEKNRAHKIIPESSSWKQKKTSGTWGMIMRMPVAVVGMIGV